MRDAAFVDVSVTSGKHVKSEVEFAAQSALSGAGKVMPVGSEPSAVVSVEQSVCSTVPPPGVKTPAMQVPVEARLRRCQLVRASTVSPHPPLDETFQRTQLARRQGLQQVVGEVW